MPITFLASVKSFRSDHEGESIITFAVPRSHKGPATQVSDCIDDVLSVTVCTSKELKQHAKDHKLK